MAATGEGYLPYIARHSVAVRNEEVPSRDAEMLMVSNSPERLLSHGLWFEGSLADLGAARLLYHHVNGTRSTGELVIELWNLDDHTARVHVVAGTGGPSGDESWAGHRAAYEFLDNRLSNSGWIVPVPPETAVPMIVHSVTAGTTVSGILSLHALIPSDIRVRLYFLPHLSRRVPHRINAYSPSPLFGKHQYPTPQREVQSEYVVGHEWAFINIGGQALAGIVEGDQLAGNYGVVYRISLEIRNPTNEPAPVEIILEAAGGPARGIVSIGGALIQAAMFDPVAEARVARYVLGPGEARTVRIETMPQGGSSYPVRLIARST
jgi:hypothetical protein